MKVEKWQKIEELFHVSLDLKESERLDFIKEKSAGDDEVFTEVQKLISAHEDSQSFIQNPVANNALEILSSEDAATIIFESKKNSIGNKIGRFKVIEKIGKGGMGEVYLAHDNSLGRDVAIKILLPEFTADSFRLKRFQLEAKAASALNHPNILTIYEIGETEDFRFIATEFVKGKTLNSYLQTEKISLQKLLKIATQIVSALQTAHEAGIIHRDIKPDNIMVRNDGIAKVLDFGLAKLLENSNNPQSQIPNPQSTMPGFIMGTPNYMSPEQARGNEIDAQTDIFSFGIVLYEMLSGKLPFSGDTTSDIIASILTKEPKPLSEINSEIPPEVEKIVAKCLQKDKQNRYQTANILLQDLEEFTEDLQAQNRLERTFTPNIDEAKTEVFKPTTVSNVEETIATTNIETNSKSLKKYLTGGLAAILIFVAGFFSYQYLLPSKQIKSIAVLPFVNESGNQDVEYLSDGITDSLIRSLSQLPNLDVKARSSVFRYKGNEIDLKKIGEELDAQAILTGRFVQRNEQINLSLELVDPTTLSVIWTEQYNRKLSELVSLQSEVARDVSTNLKNKISGEEKTKLTNNGTTNYEAYQAYLKGRYFLTKGSYDAPQQALKYFQETIALDPNFALGYAGIADCYTLIGTVMQARVTPEETILQAKTAAEKAIALDANLSEAYVSLAWIKFRYDWDWNGAERDFKKAIELNPNNAQAYQWYGEYLSVFRRDEEAIIQLKKARDLEPFNILMNWNYAKVFGDFGRFKESLSEMKKVYEMDKNFIRTYRVLRIAYFQNGMNEEAFDIFIKEQELKKETPERLEFYKKMYREKGYEETIKWFTKNVLIPDKDTNAAAKAVYYTALKDKENTLRALEEGYNQKLAGILYCKFVQFDFLKDEPRYQELLRKLNFPQN